MKPVYIIPLLARRGAEIDERSESAKRGGGFKYLIISEKKYEIIYVFF